MYFRSGSSPSWNFRNMIPSGNKRCFIKLKDELLVGFGGAQYV
jgi:hypothetical protein